MNARSAADRGVPPVRVGIIAPCPPPHGGVTRLIENLLSHWPRDEVSAHFVPMYLPPVAAPIKGARFHRLTDTKARSLRGILSYPRVLARAPLTYPWVYRHFLRYNLSLSRLIERERLNVIYAHAVWPAGASAVLQSRVAGVGSVVVAYGETFGTIPRHRRWRRTARFVCRNATHIVSPSEHCLRGALTLSADRTRASVIYAGVDVQRFRLGLDGGAWRAKKGIGPAAIVVSVLGLVLRRKLDLFLDAISLVDAPGEVVYLIGGKGEDETYVKKRVAEASGSKVELLGFVPETELPEFYAASDILVASPHTELECMGLSMKEAMACGTAVVGTRIGGIPEAIEDGVNGVLCAPEDPRDLARALSRMAADPEARSRMGAAGRATVEERFDARASARLTLNVLGQAASVASRHS